MQVIHFFTKNKTQNSELRHFLFNPFDTLSKLLLQIYTYKLKQIYTYKLSRHSLIQNSTLKSDKADQITTIKSKMATL